jgi:hypothetical protein
MNNLSNNLTHKISVNNNVVNCEVKIRLNDECKNGHQDFSITGTFWGIGKYRSDRNMICGGCCHDEILKHFPELKIFVDLHLCDYTGTPMYSIENGFYHLSKGFENLKGKTQKEYFCDYYRVTPDQYDTLILAKDKEYYGFLLFDLGILNQWKKESNKVIKKLEKLTGLKFLNDSKRTQFNMDNSQIEAVREKIKAGFYSVENIEKREAEKQAKILKYEYDKILNAKKEVTQKAQNEYNIKRFILDNGLSLENFIYYNHTNRASFNWLSFKTKVTESQFKSLCDKLNPETLSKLPQGIIFEMQDLKIEYSPV